MPMPTLADLKTHLRIRHGHEDDDLQMKLEAANSVRLAILIIAAELYANREESVVGTIYSRIPKAENMLHFYRTGLGI
ncbi:phage gp6-like head-tail connector protein [Stutzerimonas nitrititolerans]|uniref:Phage gp6-like head-tail connector protein n=1 Tax=Stutzerimonas nitrititolerans TaxID=2482751 RepID=A0ABX9URP6_9GAMM|nr:phage gp6-like head-tail connector protein [Stutzerimonas nitrititolerans]